MKHIEILISLANKLDENGLHVVADEIDGLIKRHAGENIQFFFDMDGVLADFQGAVNKGMSPQEKGFFINLDVLPGANDMLDMATKLMGHKPDILSAPLDDTPEIRTQCEAEKTAWLEKHFPDKLNHIIFSTTKYEYASPITCLIDDKPSRVKDFVEAGGLAIRHTDPSNTIAVMQELFRRID